MRSLAPTRLVALVAAILPLASATPVRGQETPASLDAEGAWAWAEAANGAYPYRAFAARFPATPARPRRRFAGRLWTWNARGRRTTWRATRDANPALAIDFKKALAQTPNDTVRLRLTGELAKLNDAATVEDIRKLVKCEDSVERMYAAEAPGDSSKDETADEVMAAIEDRDPLVRVYAAGAILGASQAHAATAPPAAGGQGK